MWEAKAAPEQADALLAWVVGHAHPDADVYQSADGRVVVIDHGDRGLPDPPAQLVARPPHLWRFERVRR
jgi:hypothetical protein